MMVIDREGRTKNAEDLSRGAMEQLYLSIRFGYISAHSTGPEPLPILMDEVLVNFDPARAKAAAAAIVEMAQTRQVLFFTCHPWVADLFRGRDPGVPVYRIADAEIAKEQDW